LPTFPIHTLRILRIYYGYYVLRLPVGRQVYYDYIFRNIIKIEVTNSVQVEVY